MGLFKFYGTDAIANLEYQIDKPNERYEPEFIGALNSISDADTFFSRFNHDNNYKDGSSKLSLGNYIAIQDDTYNTAWEIAGFDMESNQFAADNTVYDNGYGICLIPRTQIIESAWNSGNDTTGGYKSSYMHTGVLPRIVTKLQTILGSHLVNRNVLLSSSISGNNANAYTWTTAYATLMSIGQMNGTFAVNNTKYDDGEANYKLPIFNFEDFKTSSKFWSRGVNTSKEAWNVNSDGTLYDTPTSWSCGVRPLIYLR